jgi:uncharacterized protein
MKKAKIPLVLIMLLVSVLAARSAEIPYLSGRVNDYAQILSDDVRKSLGEELRAHEERTTNQVVILTIPSLEGDNIEDFSNRVFNEWKLGQKDKDNGILIVVVPDEKRMRIEVGYGLESTIPDLLASRIISNVMAPRFRAGDFDGGISDGAGAVIAALEGREVPGSDEADEPAASSSLSDFSNLESPDMPIAVRILMGAFIFGIIGLFTIMGVVTPGFGWFLYLFLIPFWAMFPIVIVGTKVALVLFFIYLIGYPVAKLLIKNTDWYKKAKIDLKKKGKASVGGFTFSSGSGGSWSSGGSSSGGFSGGGGSSGGGGASGGW